MMSVNATQFKDFEDGDNYEHDLDAWCSQSICSVIYLFLIIQKKKIVLLLINYFL